MREYRAGDAEAMYRLDVQCFDPVFRFSRRAMKLFAEAEEAVTVLVEAGGALVGFAIGEVAQGVGYVVTVDVAPGARRHGLGRRIMQELEVKALAAGAEAMVLHVFSGNEGAVKMYEAIGYERMGMARGFYGRGLDGWMYEKRLMMRA